MLLEPLTLTGNLVRLEPLRVEHAADLWKAGLDPAIWMYMPIEPIKSQADMVRLIETFLHEQKAGVGLPFAIIYRETGRAIGSTRFHSYAFHDRGVEIGSTWLAPTFQRTGVNTECKYLLLRHAFETWQVIRVQFKTDSRNLRSQRAIERLGAVKEGVLRNHMIMPDGYYRHSVYYSILDSEWPQVKAGLEEKMRAY